MQELSVTSVKAFELSATHLCLVENGYLLRTTQIPFCFGAHL